MKIIDMHVHMLPDRPTATPRQFLADLQRSGISGAAVYSKSPGVPPFAQTPSIAGRATEILNFCKEYPDTLFPVLYVHPYEDNVIEEVKEAAARGIAAFKMICNTYYVCEQRSMDLLSAMASLGKPVIFHSGILWDGNVSSEFNKPLNWEALQEIPNLRFSMGHCSWPWIDECIALYGKFLNTYTRRPDISAEMFFDITPGTPVIYRRELLTKLYTIGYDVQHNILFGLDNNTSAYNWKRAADWLSIDKKILNSLRISREARQQMYCDNFMRFLGKAEKDFTHERLSADSMLKRANPFRFR